MTRGQRLLAPSARLQETGEIIITALADFWYTQFNRSGAGVPLAPTVAVAVGETIGIAAAVSGSGEGLDFQLHQSLRGEADHLTQEVGVGGLLQQLSEVHVGRGIA
jgi:hypothetical protein